MAGQIRRVAGLEYELVRKKVKNLNLRVRRDGSVAVSVPLRVSADQADAFVAQRMGWVIAAKQQAARAARKQQDCPPPSKEECLALFEPISQKVYPAFAGVLDGQPPLQVYVKPCQEFHIILRSIDMGAMEVIRTYEELHDYCKIGSPFSIPKAALVLAGFSPKFSEVAYATLAEQLQAFGTGIEITLLSAIPAGSGLGTSSILASTVLGSLSDFCGLSWDKNEVCRRTLALEQLLTTGGGWQDQYGGVLHGVKLLQTQPGWHQEPKVRWLPDYLFTSDEYRKCHLLYYTGITRTAKGILAEIVKGMFLNSNRHLHLLEQMKGHAMDMYDAILRNDFEETGRLIRKTWKQNQLLDEGTNPAAVQALTERIDDLCLGYKLPGAGGGGYLYMVAKDPDAAVRIRRILTEPVHGGQGSGCGGAYPPDSDRGTSERTGALRGDELIEQGTGNQ